MTDVKELRSRSCEPTVVKSKRIDANCATITASCGEIVGTCAETPAISGATGVMRAEAKRGA